MSFVLDQVRLIDAQLDQLQLPNIVSTPSSPVISSASNNVEHDTNLCDGISAAARVSQLRAAITSLSTASASRIQLQPSQLQNVLEQSELLKPLAATATHEDGGQASSNEQELEWLLVGKVATQVHGLILSTLLEQTIPLSQDIWYWDQVLRSFSSLGLYSFQSSPERLWRWGKDIYQDTKIKLQPTRNTNEIRPPKKLSVQESWNRFWGVIKKSVSSHSMVNMRSQSLSPLSWCLAGVKMKQSKLKRLREMSASGLGILMDEDLTFDLDENSAGASKDRVNAEKDEWKGVVSKSVTLMETVLRNVTKIELGASEFEDTTFLSVDEDQEIIHHRNVEGQLSSKSVRLASRLQQILCNSLPCQIATSKGLVAENGRPSYTTRYWIPSVLVLLFSGTILRLFFNHRTEILAWIQDFGATVMDFWYNWVVDPLKKVIGTIRHDENSEVALMSKGSLEGDKASLERMVIDFVKDTSSTNTTLSETDIANVRAKIREGDLTPVLKAYEKDLQRPIVGTVRGDLIRALLIQIQKTKVDVEVAVGGIDALLKSQELVFGFIGLTPGVLVCVGICRWLDTTFRGHKGKARRNFQGQTVRNLRNIDRILGAPMPSSNGMLTYKEHGLLLCEIHLLRQKALQTLPREINAEFLEDLGDLADLRTGIQRQLRVADRIRWAYDKWLS